MSNNENTSFKTAIVTTCGTVTVALIGAVGVYLQTSGKNVADRSPPEPVIDQPAPTEAAEAENPLLNPDASAWFVQLGYFDSLANARTRVEQLQAAGVESVRIVKSENYPGLTQRQGSYVVVGPVTEAEAVAVMDKVKEHVPYVFVANGYVPSR